MWLPIPPKQPIGEAPQTAYTIYNRLEQNMRVRFWSETGDQYVTIRPEEFRGTVKKRRKGKDMPLPKQAKKTLGTSNAAVAAMAEAEAKGLLLVFLEDIETTLQDSGKDAMISIKLGYRSGYQLSIKLNKTSMWYNVSRETLLDCIVQYLDGSFD